MKMEDAFIFFLWPDPLFVEDMLTMIREEKLAFFREQTLFQMKFPGQAKDFAIVLMSLELFADEQCAFGIEADVSLVKKIIMIAAQQHAIVVVDRFIQMRAVTKRFDV